MSITKYLAIIMAMPALFFLSSVSAADLSPAKEALKMISDFAMEICQSPPVTGSTENLELTGEEKRNLVDL